METQIKSLVFLIVLSFGFQVKAQLKETFSYQERIQLLKMSTFGINAELLQNVNEMNSENTNSKEIAWLDSQLNSPSAYDDSDDNWKTHLQRVVELTISSMPTIDFYENNPKWHKHKIFNRLKAEWITSHYQMSAWWDNALGNVNLSPKIGSDQLRQRTAYALSQLLVVSKSASPLERRSEGLAHYYDLLAKNALGNYENLLQEILRSPAMGVFLSSAFNKKASLANNTRPDENLAREFLQLFTIGPYELNLDGSVKMDQQGDIIPTYSQNDIMEMAKILTGWILFDAQPWNAAGAKTGSYVHLMKFHSGNHEYEHDDYYTTDTDRGVVTLFKGKPFETKVDLNATDEMKDGAGLITASGLDAAINVVFNHPNVGPFVSRHLIKHFVTSNPTPGYIERVATVFNDDGSGVRGNLKAVVRAILLDEEAYNQSIELGGKVKEPLLAFTQFLRAMKARPWPKTQSIRSLKDDTGAFLHPEYLEDAFVYSGAESELNQAALRSLDVFNFYDPNFKPPDDMLMENYLISPESEILNDTFFPNFQNMLMKVIRYYSNRRLKCEDPENLIGLDNAQRVNFYQPNFIIDLSEPISALIKGLGRESGKLDDVRASDFEIDAATTKAINQLLDWYEDNLLFTKLSENFRSALTNLCKNGLQPSLWKNSDYSEQRVLAIVENTLLLLVLSPEFMVDAGMVPDVTPPKIEMLGKKNMTLAYGSTYVEPGYRATDNVYFGNLDSKVTISGDVNQWEPGTYRITYSVVDAAGNVTETTERIVTISEKPKPVDKVPPIVDLIGEATLQILVSSEYDEPGYSATDDQDGNITELVKVVGEVNASKPGNYQLTYSVSDDAGNLSDEVIRTIVVIEPVMDRDNVPPQLILYGTSIVYLYKGDKYEEPGFMAIDNLDGDLTRKVIVDGEVNSIKSGKYEILYSVRDNAGNSSGSFKRTVIVSELDNMAPDLVLLGAEVVKIPEEGVYNEPGYHAFDNKDGNLTAEVLVEGDVNSSLPGTYELFYSVRDAAGNLSDLLKRTIVVEEKDREPPQIVLFGYGTLELKLGDQYAEAGFNATDNKDGDISAKVVIVGNVDTNVAGEYVLSYSVKDSAGNSSKTISRKILVMDEISKIDSVPPVVVLLGQNEIKLFLEDPYIESGYNATDDRDGNISSEVIVTGSVNSMKLGTYELSYSVIDTAGNKSDIQKRTIVVSKRSAPNDVAAPVVELIGGEVLQIIAGSTFMEPGYSAMDDVDGDLTSQVVIKGKVDAGKPGNYSIFYSVQDMAGNNSALVKRTVIVSPSVTDNIPPKLVLFGSETIYHVVNEPYFEPGYEAIDSNDGVITSKVQIDGDFNSSKAGTYELFYSVSDNSGNKSLTFKRTLIFSEEDKTPPKIALKGSKILVLNLGDEYVEAGYLAVDNRDGHLTSKVVVSGEVITSEKGVYELTYSVSDAAGNMSPVLKRKVIVLDTALVAQPKYWWSSFDRIGYGFYESWFGQFMPFASGWIYHLEFGWVFVVDRQEHGIWMWLQREGWLWVRKNVWPHLWSSETGSWIYFVQMEQKNYFFDYSIWEYRKVDKN